MITVRWGLFGWEAYHNGRRVRGRAWRLGDMPRRFSDPDKCMTWAAREVAALARTRGAAS